MSDQTCKHCGFEVRQSDNGYWFHIGGPICGHGATPATTPDPVIVALEVRVASLQAENQELRLEIEHWDASHQALVDQIETAEGRVASLIEAGQELRRCLSCTGDETPQAVRASAVWKAVVNQ